MSILPIIGGEDAFEGVLKLLPEYLIEHDQKYEENVLEQSENVHNCHQNCDRGNWCRGQTVQLQQQAHDAHENFNEGEPSDIHENYFALLDLPPPETLACGHVFLEVEVSEEAQKSENEGTYYLDAGDRWIPSYLPSGCHPAHPVETEPHELLEVTENGDRDWNHNYETL